MCHKTGRLRDAEWVKGADRTIEGIAQFNEQWLEETGGDRSKLKNYYNCEHLPLIGVDPDATTATLVHSRVPIALLHTLLLNPTNLLLKHLGGVWPQLGAWLKGLHVVKEAYHGETFEGKKTSQSLSSTMTFFAGNECRKISLHLDKSCTYKEEVHPSLADTIPPEHQPYLDALLALRQLNDMANLVRMKQTLLLQLFYRITRKTNC